jgi:hypothetical protein
MTQDSLTRDQMIYELTKFELEYLVGDPHLIKEMVRFFSDGGFNNYNYDYLKRQYEIIFAD